MEFKIITGTAQQCQDEMNELRKKHFISVLGMSATNESTTILLELSSS